jgi:hypothetical protein
VSDSREVLLRRIRAWIVIMMVGLVIAGVTAFPLTHEVRWLTSVLHNPHTPLVKHAPWLTAWIAKVTTGVTVTSAKYPFIAYGTDWLAYAHLMIALAFIGPYRDPERNVWIVQWAMIACLSIIPLALIAGPVRHIPFWWSCIDMSFGVFGLVPLLFVYRYIKRLTAVDTVVSVEPAALVLDGQPG